ncbi:NAD(P)/FAD-dependent oxidoreductase [candidate division KSB3 bacterium]|uniref:NAD(P)/FAD-dependent oxidoreductase n=1 Tax=candidate division KSB3 bacterium TaxID=2044937 RepID=A0A9D5JYA2_9BACT|nr:NAD(P)/FAD-dependent oxidoreductase [candidate division KSB3 bacterium]MBD3326047.1 NAD(P)/FAD-dependent oxidoreductase [candidate division KSB3 bacterium]
MQTYDLIVLGSGVAGATIAATCRSADWHVALVESRVLGGTCALRGCNPKKVLVAAAEAVDRVRHMQGKGIAGAISLDWPELIGFKETFTEAIPEKTAQKFSDRGVDIYQGQPRFTDTNTLQVAEQTLRAKQIVIATGAKPRALDIPGAEYLTTSDQVLEMTSLPDDLLFIGAGYISLELAHVAAQAGAHVTILEALPQPLKQFDPDLVDMLLQASREKGIDIHLETPVASIEKHGETFMVRAGNDGAQTFEVERVIHGAGRVPNLDGLDLEAGGIQTDGRQIVVNSYLQSVSNPAVYIAGDVNASGIPLTPVASMEAGVVVTNLLEGNSAQPDYTGVPSVLFTSPPLASAGMTEDAAQQAGRAYEVVFQDTSSENSTRRLGLHYSGLKVLIEKETHHIIGAHLLGHNVDEVINIFTLLIRAELDVSALKETVWAFPTVFDYHVDAIV